jgi:hypothetical protein
MLVLLIGCTKEKITEKPYLSDDYSYMVGQIDFVTKQTDTIFHYLEIAKKKIIDLEERRNIVSNPYYEVAVEFLKIHNMEIVPITNYYLDYILKKKDDIKK